MQPDVLVDSIIVYINMVMNCISTGILAWMLYEIRKIGSNRRSEEFMSEFKGAITQLASTKRVNDALDATRGEGTITRE